jgi:hypothetical protein
VTEHEALADLRSQAAELGYRPEVIEEMARRFFREAGDRRTRVSVCEQLALALSLHASSTRTFDVVRDEVNTYMRRWLDDLGLDRL